MNCADCGIVAEPIPWADEKHHPTKAYMLLLTRWARTHALVAEFVASLTTPLAGDIALKHATEVPYQGQCRFYSQHVDGHFGDRVVLRLVAPLFSGSNNLLLLISGQVSYDQYPVRSIATIPYHSGNGNRRAMELPVSCS